MNDSLKNINDSDFEKLFASSLPVPDRYVVANITPFKTAMRKVIIGMALSLFVINVGFINLIMPIAGALLLLLGFKALRKENKYLSACFTVSVLQLICILPICIINSTIYHSEIKPLLSYLNILNIALDIILLILFFYAIRDIFRKADLPYNKTYGILIVVWYAVLALLAFINYNGLIIPAVMIIAFVVILIGLYKLSLKLEEAGFVIETAAPKISDRAVALTVTGIFAAVMLCGYIFFGSYDMKWELYTPAVSEETEEIKESLIKLGFPGHILEDMKEEEILLLKDASRVVSESKDSPLNSGREVTETRNENGTVHRIISTVYDVKELRTTGIAVKLPSEKERWRIIQHFEWVHQPKYFGTESVQLWNADKISDGWYTTTDVTGQVLYSKDGKEYASPYYSVGTESYVSESIIGKDSRSDIFLEFSLPKDAERQRGYVTYEIQCEDSSYLIDEWINYTHQISPFQYPVMTAKERRMKDNWNKSGVFRTVQDAIQFSY